MIDRDQTLIPSGWDSWGKIKILRETFDCDKTGRGWESDFEVRDQLRRGPPSGDSNVDGSVERAREGGLRNHFEMVIVDFEAEDTLKVSRRSLFSLYTTLELVPTILTFHPHPRPTLCDH